MVQRRRSHAGAILVVACLLTVLGGPGVASAAQGGPPRHAASHDDGPGRGRSGEASSDSGGPARDHDRGPSRQSHDSEGRNGPPSHAKAAGHAGQGQKGDRGRGHAERPDPDRTRKNQARGPRDDGTTRPADVTASGQGTTPAAAPATTPAVAATPSGEPSAPTPSDSPQATPKPSPDEQATAAAPPEPPGGGVARPVLDMLPVIPPSAASTVPLLLLLLGAYLIVQRGIGRGLGHLPMAGHGTNGLPHDH